MGLLKLWKRVKAVAATGTRDGRPPGDVSETAVGLAGAYMRMIGPLLASQAPERGRPLPASEAGALEPQGEAGLAAGIEAVRARDSAFDPQLLTSFAQQVFDAVSAAWATGEADAIRPVVADEIWEPLAAASAAPVGAGAGQFFGREVGRLRLTAVRASDWYDSALFHVDVSVDLPRPKGRPPRPGATEWTEEWLFQRSRTPGGDPTARAAHCPSCGAPTEADAGDLCTHCRRPIPVMTAGWLLTAVRSDRPGLGGWPGQAQGGEVPPELLERLPADVVTQLSQVRPADGLAAPPRPPAP